MVPRRIPTRERGRESSRLRLVNNSVCIKVVARAILRRQRTTTLREGGMLCESWTRLAGLNFPDKVSGNVGGGLVARKKKKGRRVKGGETRKIQLKRARSNVSSRGEGFFNQNLGIRSKSLFLERG